MGRNKINEDGKITPLAFAQIAGCDKSAVMKAISLGHLEDAVTRNANNHIRIDPEKARANWAKNWADTAKTPPKLREFLRSALGSQTAKTRAAVRASDIDWTALSDIRAVGVTAGASAPEVIVDEVVKAFQDRFDVTIDVVTTAEERVIFNVPRELRAGADTPRNGN